MLTLRKVVDFYYSQFDTIKLNIQMIEEIDGKTVPLTKTDLTDILEGWGDDEVISFGLQTYYHSYQHLGSKMDIPTAWIYLK